MVKLLNFEEKFDIDVTKEKLNQALWVFEFLVPFDQIKIKNFRFKNIEFAEFMKSIIVSIRENYPHHSDAMASHIRLIKEMCDYILNETVQWPTMDTDDLQQVIDHYYIQSNQWGKDQIVKLQVKDGRIQCL